MKRYLIKILSLSLACVMFVSTAVVIRAEDYNLGWFYDDMTDEEFYAQFGKTKAEAEQWNIDNGIVGMDNWSASDKTLYFLRNFFPILKCAYGLLADKTALNMNDFINALEVQINDSSINEENLSYQEWLAREMGISEDGTALVLSDSLVDVTKEALDTTIESSAQYILLKTRTIDYVVDTLTKASADTIAYVRNLTSEGAVVVYSNNYASSVQSTNSFNLDNFYLQLHSDGKKCYVGNKETGSLTLEGTGLTTNALNTYYPIFNISSDGYANVGVCGLFTSVPRTVRAFASYDDYLNYRFGNRNYIAGSQYYNYDNSIDNSTTITNTDMSNYYYGDTYSYETVNNYITNNYENVDGLTEEELMEILDKYFEDNKNNGSNSDNNTDTDNGTGNGLLDFLKGLGSIGDALLSILGLLLEYVGKALSLLTDTIGMIVDIIPTSVTNLMGALFPFIPKEWLDIIQLSLVLSLIGALIGGLKK